MPQPYVIIHRNRAIIKRNTRNEQFGAHIAALQPPRHPDAPLARLSPTPSVPRPTAHPPLTRRKVRPSAPATYTSAAPAAFPAPAAHCHPSAPAPVPAPRKKSARLPAEVLKLQDFSFYQSISSFVVSLPNVSEKNVKGLLFRKQPRTGACFRLSEIGKAFQTLSSACRT